MPFFAVLLVDVQRTFRLLTDEQYGGNLYPITTAKCPSRKYRVVDSRKPTSRYWWRSAPDGVRRLPCDSAERHIGIPNMGCRLRTDLPKQSQDVLKVCVLGGTSKAAQFDWLGRQHIADCFACLFRGRTLVCPSTWKIIGVSDAHW